MSLNYHLKNYNFKENLSAISHKPSERRVARINKFLEDEDISAPIDISDLLMANDTAFIFQCYRQILGRNPDTSGYHFYINELQSFKKTKIQIVKIMRWSHEGRCRKRVIKGLYRAVLSDFIARRLSAFHKSTTAASIS